MQFEQFSYAPESCGALSISGACAALGDIGRSTLYELIRDGRLASVKIGARRVIPREAIAAFLSSHTT